MSDAFAHKAALRVIYRSELDPKDYFAITWTVDGKRWSNWRTAPSPSQEIAPLVPTAIYPDFHSRRVIVRGNAILSSALDETGGLNFYLLSEDGLIAKKEFPYQPATELEQSQRQSCAASDTFDLALSSCLGITKDALPTDAPAFPFPVQKYRIVHSRTSAAVIIEAEKDRVYGDIAASQVAFTWTLDGKTWKPWENLLGKFIPIRPDTITDHNGLAIVSSTTFALPDLIGYDTATNEYVWLIDSSSVLAEHNYRASPNNGFCVRAIRMADYDGQRNYCF